MTPPDTLTKLMIGDQALARLTASQWQEVFAVAFEALGTIGAGKGTIEPHSTAREALLDIHGKVRRMATRK